jgi:hypothetical protein
MAGKKNMQNRIPNNPDGMSLLSAKANFPKFIMLSSKLCILGLSISERSTNMKKQIPALIAAILITACVAIAMLGVGLNALLNKNSVAAANTNANAAQVSQVSASDQAQIAQLQARIQEYQQREEQYKQLLQQSQTQLQDAQTQVQQAAEVQKQFTAFLQALQQRGIIRIQGDGTVMITARPIQ